MADSKADDNKAKPAQDGDDYDPHLNRDIPKGTTYFETLLNMVKGALGTGILAMPQAIRNSGMLTGIIATGFIGFLCTYCLHILLKSSYMLCKRNKVPLYTYSETMKEALMVGPKCLQPTAKCLSVTVDCFIILYQLGICCVYAVFVPGNVKSLVEQYWDKEIRLELYILMFYVPFLVISFIKTLKLMAVFSLVANICTIIAFSGIAYFLVQDLPDITERPHFNSFYTLPLFFGTTLFALESVGVIMSIENNMKEPKRFVTILGALNISMFIVTVMYMLMGMMGYWRYGDEIHSSITFNLPNDHPLSAATKGIYAVAIYISFGLQGYPPLTYLIQYAALTKPMSESTRPDLYGAMIRVGTITLTVFVAAAIPLLGLYISLFGAFCLSALGFAFPALIELCVRWEEKKFGPGKIILIQDILLMLFGLFGLIVGSYCALSEIVVEMKKRYE